MIPFSHHLSFIRRFACTAFFCRLSAFSVSCLVWLLPVIFLSNYVNSRMFNYLFPTRGDFFFGSSLHFSAASSFVVRRSFTFFVFIVCFCLFVYQYSFQPTTSDRQITGTPCSGFSALTLNCSSDLLRCRLRTENESKY